MMGDHYFSVTINFSVTIFGPFVTENRIKEDAYDECTVSLDSSLVAPV
jgi:hypothetical protein